MAQDPHKADHSRWVPRLTEEIVRARRHDLGGLLERSAAKFPGKLAVVHRDVRRTYSELDEDVNRVANGLLARGVTRGVRAAVFSHNSYEFVVTYFALARLGAISVPVNFNFTPEELAYVLSDCEPTVAVVEAGLVPTTVEAAALAGATLVDRFVVGPAQEGWTPFTELLEHADATPVVSPVDDDDPVQLLYTSGTTSRPKGAIMTNRNLIAQYVSGIVDGEYHSDDVELHALPLYHCAALHDFLTPDVYVGATSVLIDTPTPDGILDAVERYRITKMFCPPTVWIGLLRSPRFASTDLSSLQKGYYGAAVMPVPVLQELGERLPGIRLFNFYGQTELAPNATVLAPHEQIEHAGSAGRANLNVLTRLHDDEDRPVAAGEVGEIVHRTPHLMRGYWGKQEATDEAFKGGWFHSGDLGVMDAEGYLTIVDRKKDLIITGGENVASREVEDALYAHPAVAEVAVFGLPHPYWIEAVSAAVVAKQGHTIDPEELTDFVRASLAPFKVPKRVLVVDALPKNPSGKILKRTLRDDHADLFREGP